MLKLAGALLIIAGLVHAIPALYFTLAAWTGGVPIIQILVGIVAVIVGIMLFAKSPAHAPRY